MGGTATSTAVEASSARSRTGATTLLSTRCRSPPSTAGVTLLLSARSGESRPMACRKKRPKLKRTLDARGNAAVHPYALAVGELSWASNYCLNFLHLLYRELFDKEDINIAVRIWHTQRSDRAQLNLIDAALAGNRRLPRPMKDEIAWVISKALALAEKRNDAIHATTQIVMRPRAKVVASSYSNLPTRYERLSGHKSMIRQHRLVTGDFLSLSGYVFFLWSKLVFPSPSLLPKRPQLRSV